MDNEIELNIDDENVYLPKILQEEQKRQKNEAQRVQNEAIRNINENQRKSNETLREYNETVRNENEQKRKQQLVQIQEDVDKLKLDCDTLEERVNTHDNTVDEVNTARGNNNSLNDRLNANDTEVNSIKDKLNKKIYYFTNIEEMKNSANLKAGDVCQTLGYYEADDGGQGLYQIVDDDTLVDDGGSIHDLVNGLKAVLIIEDIFINEIEQTKVFRDSESDTTYYITEIPYKDKKGNILKPQIGIANDDDTLSSSETNLSFAHRKHSTISINAGTYSTSNFKPVGSLIQNGEILRNVVVSDREYLAYGDDGILKSYDSQTISAEDMINLGIKNALIGWYAIVKNGIFIPHETSVVGGDTVAPRQVIAQKANLDYVILTCDGRTIYDKGMTLQRCAEILINNYNCTFAYNLDGGGSTSICYQEIKQNKNIDNYYEDREVSNFLYWSKSEIIKNDIKDSFKQIALLKQDMIKRFICFRDVYNGYLKILSTNNYPGIEFYGNGDFENRRGKLSMEENKVYFSYPSGMLLESNNDRGLYNPKIGWLGQFRDSIEAKNPSDFNNYLPTGIYLHNSSSTDAGIGQPAIVIVLTWLRTGYNTRQIYIPLNSKIAKPIMYRERFSSGNFTEWYPINAQNCTTSNRPNLNSSAKGYQTFDTSLGKPIWWNGTDWTDANGDIV